MRNRKTPGLPDLSVNTLKERYRGAYLDREDVSPDAESVKNRRVVKKTVTE